MRRAGLVLLSASQMRLTRINGRMGCYHLYGPPQSCKRKTEKDSLVCANVFGL